MSFQDQFGKQPRGNGGSDRRYYENDNSADVERGYQQPRLFSSPTEYDNNLQAISNNIREISTNVAQIKQLSNTLGTSKENMDTRGKMNYLIESTRTLVKNTSSDFNLIDLTKGTQEERNKKRILRDKLLKDFRTWVEQVQEVATIAVKKEKSTAPPQQNVSKPTSGSRGQPFPGFSSFEDDEYEMQREREQQQAQRRNMQLQNETQFNEAIIQEREKGIKEIEQAVIEVNEIFRDVSSLVVEQGQLIDNIESNIEESVDSSSRGVVELRAASNYQKKSRTKLCCFALILMIILAVIAVVLFVFAR